MTVASWHVTDMPKILAMSVIGRTAEDMCSLKLFRLRTRTEDASLFFGLFEA
jgi:hypothetical protein